MKKIIEKTNKHRFAIAVVAVIALGAASAILSLNASVAEAITERTIGGVSGTVVPYATGGEYLTFSYNGAGVLDLEGWIVTSDNGSTYIIRDLVVDNGGTVRACQIEDNLHCAAIWPGGALFDDIAGVVTLQDDSGNIVYTIDYGDTVVGNGSSFAGDGVYRTSVYGKPDKIELCHLNKKGEYTKKQNTAGSFMNGYNRGSNGHHADVEDIIAPFFYAADSSAVATYFPGLNVDKVGMIAADCI